MTGQVGEEMEQVPQAIHTMLASLLAINLVERLDLVAAKHELSDVARSTLIAALGYQVRDGDTNDRLLDLDLHECEAVRVACEALLDAEEATEALGPLVASIRAVAEEARRVREEEDETRTFEAVGAHLSVAVGRLEHLGWTVPREQWSTERVGGEVVVTFTAIRRTALTYGEV